MGTIKAIRNDADYHAALARVDALMNAEPGGPPEPAQWSADFRQRKS